MSRYLKILVGTWVVFVLLPALARAGAASATTAGTLRSAQALDATVGAYLAFCPVGTASYALSAVVLAPLLLLFASLHTVGPKRPGALWLSLTKVVGAWCSLNAVCLLLLFSVEVVKGCTVSSALSWNAKIWLFLLISGLPATAFGCLLATLLERRTWRTLLVAAAVAALVGLLGLLGPAVGFLWTPATADRFLLSGRGEQWWPGVAIAVAWFTGVMTLAMTLTLTRLRTRLPATTQ